MNKNNAIEKAQKILAQKPSPKELDPAEVDAILVSLGCDSKGKNSDHTTYRYYHSALENEQSYFLYGILKVSIGHKKGAKSVIRIGSVKLIIKALELILDSENLL